MFREPAAYACLGGHQSYHVLYPSHCVFLTLFEIGVHCSEDFLVFFHTLRKTFKDTEAVDNTTWLQAYSARVVPFL